MPSLQQRFKSHAQTKFYSKKQTSSFIKPKQVCDKTLQAIELQSGSV